MFLKIKKLKLKVLLLIFLCILAYLLSVNLAHKNSFDLNDKNFVIKRVAHAGGGIDKQTYTNSIDALNNSLAQGFVYFELDMDFTSDGVIVCTHGWNKENNFKIFGVNHGKVPTLDEFLELKKRSKYNACTLESLISWMGEHKNTYIVTDVKGDNIKALEIISKLVPDYKTRIIPQIYYPSEFNKVKAMGYEQIIFTLYKTDMKNAKILKAIKKFEKPFAITMTKNRAQSGLSYELSKMNIPTYVHTVNSEIIKNELINKYKVSDIYTDFLKPNN